MKKYTHAWLALKAVEVLESYSGSFCAERNQHLEDLLKFLSDFPSTFVRGAWFPDIVIKDNTEGTHTWKYYPDPVKGRSEARRPPKHNACLQVVGNKLKEKVSLNAKTSDLPDRCESLSQSIRDMVLITNYVPSRDVIRFNDSQIATLFLMLAHYICDAHMPVHCDNRDFYDPSSIHPDMEEYWEREVTKYCKLSPKREQFALDEANHVCITENGGNYPDSLLGRTEGILKNIRWENFATADTRWQALLGAGNNNLWDYAVAVCLVSFQVSQCLFPAIPAAGIDYNTLKIMETDPFKENVIEFSPKVLADAINSTALVWLSTWERWQLFK